MSRLANTFIDNLSALLLVFGVGLFTIGGSVRATRHLRLSQAQQERLAPEFEQSIQVEALATPTPLATVPPPPDRLVIPAIGVDSPVVELGWEARIIDGENVGSEWQTASFAVGFHKDSLPPGAGGNTVMSGHNNIEGAVFKNLHLLDSGDRVFVHAGATQYAYEVETNFVVKEQGVDLEQHQRNARWIGPTPDERLTMVTCFPGWSNTHRTIIIARPLAGEVVSGYEDVPFG